MRTRLSAYFRTISISIWMIVGCVPATQGQVSLKALMDSSTMFIGQQSVFHLILSTPKSNQISFPVLAGDTLVNGLEIIQKSPIDTVFTSDGRMEMTQHFLVTSFDSGLYYIPPIPVTFGTDTFFSNDLGLKIVTLDVDTVKKTLFDIKGVQKPPFYLSDYLTLIVCIIALYALILLLIWIYLKRKYRITPDMAIELENTLPPHISAIMELDKIKQDKIWKQGRNKEYYTQLSEVIRKYLSRRFQINALEMTTEELLSLFRKDKITQSVYQNLKQILQLSDLVKFAKIEPLESDHELSMMNSYLFVNQTKQEEVKSIEEQKDEMINNDLNSEGVGEKTTDVSEEMSKYMPK